MASYVSTGDELLRRVEKLRKHVSGETTIRSLDDLLPEVSGDPRLSPYWNHPTYRRLAENAEEEQVEQERQDWEVYERNNCLECRRALDSCICKSMAGIPRRVRDVWTTVLGQVEIQSCNDPLTRTRLRDIKLVSFDEKQLVVEVSRHFPLEWLSGRLLEAMTKTFNEIYFRNPLERVDQAILIKVQVEPEPLMENLSAAEYLRQNADGGQYVCRTC